jgi:hypothetical protein
MTRSARPLAVKFCVAFCYYNADCHYAECPYTEFHYAECPYTECHYAKCPYTEFHYAECRGTVQITLFGTNSNYLKTFLLQNFLLQKYSFPELFFRKKFNQSISINPPPPHVDFHKMS